ncbi:MAG: outer membrane protein assembly factor BamB family protein [Planctomycetota bacterium]
MIRQGVLGLVLLAALARAGEPDASRAAAERWTHPHGSAAGNARSFARAPDSFGGIVWRYKAQKTLLAPPLTWDGAVFVLDGRSLAALDAENGRVLARTIVNTDQPGKIAVHDRDFFCLEGKRLVQYRLRGRKLTRGWSFEVGGDASAPAIVSGEIYLTTQGGLLRLRAGARKPAWKIAGDYVGDPAAYGDHVYALKRAGSRLELTLHARTDGQVVTSVDLGSAPAGRGGRVAVTETILGAQIPGSPGIWAIVGCKRAERGPPELTFSRNETLGCQPSAGRTAFLALAHNPPTWCYVALSKNSRRQLMPVVNAKRHPELAKSGVAPISLNWPTICFGTWAGNIHSMRILWRLDERPEIKALRNGVRFHAVPARHELLLLVAKDGQSLHAIGPEEIG